MQHNPSGTILSGDVTALFSHEGHTLDNYTRTLISIDPDFDGYLAELSKGLCNAIDTSGSSDLKIAVVMPGRMMGEAAQARMTGAGEIIRAFAASQTKTAQDWVATK